MLAARAEIDHTADGRGDLASEEHVDGVDSQLGGYVGASKCVVFSGGDFGENSVLALHWGPGPPLPVYPSPVMLCRWLSGWACMVPHTEPPGLGQLRLLSLSPLWVPVLNKWFIKASWQACGCDTSLAQWSTPRWPQTRTCLASGWPLGTSIPSPLH